MDSILSKVAYLNGLVEGLGIDDKSKEGKAILAISNVLKQMAEEIEEIKDSQIDMEDYMDAIDEDLSDVEDDLYGDDYDCNSDDDFEEVHCPYCDEVVYVDRDICEEHDEITCPNCHKNIEVECGCGCCDCEDKE